ncbi:LUC7-like 2 [Alligator mississippiensis]|uniref:LUC7-like 2 n=1 Tax=Alligator mississippiensis TaxID=8496 RepID=A0A151LYY3_ALLMI|nr:LUC7-like 2 [Alligator mississippiensis]
MSAQAQMRAMLDQLMGTSRDGDTTRQRIKFSDDRVCKSHLLNCCPHDVLSGTRMDLGECLKVHDLALRADYEIASKEQDFFFELDAMDHLQSFIADCDRRTEVAKKRLAETQEEISAEVAAKAERVHELNEEIGKLLAKVEQLGADGNVEESQKVMDEVEKARAKKREAEEVYRNSMPASSFQQQKLRVCEVCSAYLGLHDNDRRLADHFGGKLHLGFIEIREKLEELRFSCSPDPIASKLKDLGLESAADIGLVLLPGNGKGELVPSPGRNATVTGLALTAAAGATATIEAGIVPGTGAESAAPKNDPQKKDLPETKNDQKIVTEHHVTKTEAQERGHPESRKTGNVPMKVLMDDQKTGEAQKSVKQGRYNRGCTFT